MAQHNITGKQGEELAAIYLEEHGYTLLHKNWRHKNWEVDIIACRNNRLHIIEVKTRKSTIFGHPEDNMSNGKMQYLINAAEEYLYANPQWKQLQFDILAITILNDVAEYFLIEDVYL
jgi:putative endonuclease